jgi:hypothetical protein
MQALLFSILLGAMPSQPITPANLTLNGAALADADGASVPATSAAVDSERLGVLLNQITWVLDVTWGTSTTFSAKCKTSTDGTNYGWIPFCDGTANPVACAPFVWTFAAADWADGKINFSVPSRSRYMICQFWDAAEGTGTIVARLNRSSQ